MRVHIRKYRRARAPREEQGRLGGVNARAQRGKKDTEGAEMRVHIQTRARPKGGTRTPRGHKCVRPKGEQGHQGNLNASAHTDACAAQGGNKDAKGA